MLVRFEIRVTGAERFTVLFDDHRLTVTDDVAETVASSEQPHRVTIDILGQAGARVKVSIASDAGFGSDFVEEIEGNGRLGLVIRIPGERGGARPGDGDDWAGERSIDV